MTTRSTDFIIFAKNFAMIKSMTGFGKATGTHNGRKIVLEIRALNSKGLDLYLKTPPFFKEKEIELRKIIGNNLDRGKIEAIIHIENTESNGSYSINKGIAKTYYQEIKAIAEEVGANAEELFSNIFRLPDVLNQQEASMTEDDWLFLQKLVTEALSNINEFRTQEGQSLFNDLSGCIDRIHEGLKCVPQYEQERIDTVRERMTKALDELAVAVDENRLEQELIFYIEKLDVSEEKVRLKNHLDYFIETMRLEENAGKKLGFIAQEIGREINTLGSKANHAELQKIVVNMKDNLEKIKEQILNTL
jgi:uncharacterized protein (TIGR00255 family)